MPAKRNKAKLDTSQKLPRSTRGCIDTETTEHFPLLDLPTEMLDNVLSYIIEILSRPSNAALNADVIAELFPQEATQVNQLLHQRTTDVAFKSVLWLEFTCLDRAAIKIVKDLDIALPVVPPAYQSLLPSSLEEVSFSFGSAKQTLRTTRIFTEENASFLFPFDH